jgi:hypothetical protein
MGSTIKGEHLRWFGRTIPYVIDHSVEHLRRFIEGDTTTTGAIQILQEQTHLRFVTRSDQSDYIRFIHGEACSSAYGRQGGMQDVHLNKHTCERSDTVIHEIAHAVGMRHEHSRRDRDRFVNVHWENIEDGKQHWFEKYSASEGTEQGLYDFSSLMHYRSCGFGRKGYYWTSGWTTAVMYEIDGIPYLFLLKVRGVGSDGHNVHIHRLNSDGSVGDRIASYKWTEGWTTAISYVAGGAPYLFLLKAWGFGSDGNNVHIHRLNSDGGVGDRVASYKWTEGWTTAIAYMAGGAPYLFLLKVSGFGIDGNNVHIHKFNSDGDFGDRVASYKWTEGWTTALVYEIGDTPYLFLLKSSGFGSHGNNVHIHAIDNNGSVGDWSSSNKWTQGWTTAVVYKAGGASYLLVLKASGFGRDGNNVHIHTMNKNGSVGARVASYSWTPGWTTAVVYEAGGTPYLFLLKAQGVGSDGNNVYIEKLGVNGTVDGRVTICPTLSFKSQADSATYTGNPAGMGGSTLTDTDLETLDNLPRGILHAHVLQPDGTLGRRRDTRHWTNGWTTGVTYIIAGQAYILFLKRVGAGTGGNNVHIHKINRDGRVGDRVASYKWTQGWTTAIVYQAGGVSYLFLLKASGFGNDGHNVHIHKVNSDGGIGDRVASYKWTQGWTTAIVYQAGGASYLLLLKVAGFGSDGNSVHFHALTDKGSIGSRVVSYKWTPGWTMAIVYQAGGVPYLLLLKASGFGNDGNNVHIHKVNSDGSVGNRIASYKWTPGWTTAVVYEVGGSPYLFVLKASGFGIDGHNVHIHKINSNGSVGDRVASYKWAQGWTTVGAYTVAPTNYLFLLRPAYPS